MSEKQFPATPRRRQEARKKGQVFKSTELNSAILLLGFLGVLKFWLPEMLQRTEKLFGYVWSLKTDWTLNSVSDLMLNLTGQIFIILSPILGAAVVLSLLSNYFQVGSLFTFEPIKPQLSRISLINGAKRMFGLKAWVELSKSLLKVLLTGYFLYASIRDNLEVFPSLQQVDISQSVAFLGQIIAALAWKIAILFLILAIFDYIYQWWEHEKNLRMSHEELKQEFKQTEGNPELRAEIKKKQRAMAMRRMMQDLKNADVVIINPTHFAVALRYDIKEKKAPFVVAKGQDEVAKRIRQLAEEYEIAIMENKPLARALYTQVEIGQTIPNDLYKAVAEVLAFVYRLKKKRNFGKRL
ncbi:MAG TPA: flagellar biosynthesis protein FlhB [Desulfitobacteriaceae bacterium]|nr:flagellar biosynthesis protein FlhB [Desulfitobacteriaceae bacterium]